METTKLQPYYYEKIEIDIRHAGDLERALYNNLVTLGPQNRGNESLVTNKLLRDADVRNLLKAKIVNNCDFDLDGDPEILRSWEDSENKVVLIFQCRLKGIIDCIKITDDNNYIFIDERGFIDLKKKPKNVFFRVFEPS